MIIEGKYGEHRIYRAANGAQTKNDPPQDVVEMEEKHDNADVEKDKGGMEEKWYKSHHDIKPETEHASKQVSAHSRPELWR
jgi:hypothetical protein